MPEFFAAWRHGANRDVTPTFGKWAPDSLFGSGASAHPLGGIGLRENFSREYATPDDLHFISPAGC